MAGSFYEEAAGGGGGGGATTTSGTYAARGAGTTAGDQYWATDGPYQSLWGGAAWTDFLPGWGPVTVPPSSGWTWFNQGTSTVTTVGGVRRYNIETGGTFRGQYRTPPAAPYTLDVYFEVTQGSAGGAYFFGWENATSGKQLFCGINNGDMRGTRRTNLTLNSAIYNVGSNDSYGTHRYGMRFENDSTNLIVYMLPIKGDPVIIHSETIATHVTSADRLVVAVTPGTPATASSFANAPVTVLDWTEA